MRSNSNGQWDWSPSASGTAITYGLNALNQVTSAGGAAINYDAKGNLTGDGAGGVLTYNNHDWLTASNNGASLVYDALGRIASVTASGATTQFLYDGQELIGEYSSSTNALRRYVPGDGADDFVSWVDNTGLGRMALLPNDQGSVVAVAHTKYYATVQAFDTYDDYGVPGSSNQGRIQYTGQAYLPEIGYYSYEARMYSPTLGRFLQTDPIGYGDGVNWYAYTHNDLVNGTDPTGTSNLWNISGTVAGGPYTYSTGNGPRYVPWGYNPTDPDSSTGDQGVYEPSGFAGSYSGTGFDSLTLGLNRMSLDPPTSILIRVSPHATPQGKPAAKAKQPTRCQFLEGIASGAGKFADYTAVAAVTYATAGAITDALGGGPASIPADAVAAPQLGGAAGLGAVGLVSGGIAVLAHGVATGNFTDAAAYIGGVALSAATGLSGDAPVAISSAGVAITALQDASSTGHCP